LHDGALKTESFTASVRQSGGHAVSLLSSVALVASMVAAAYLCRKPPIAIYSLSFWHYYLYGLAYFFGAVSLDVFKRDAIAMKTVSLIVLAAAYFSAPLDLASLLFVACGLLLNILAARALGSDRTYYGHEVADLPRRRIRTFPYSWISMLVGNITAFGGTLINADFRSQWWPLACAHVALNLGLLFMELAVTPQRRGARRIATEEAAPTPRRYSIWSACCIVAVGAVICGAVSACGIWSIGTLPAASIGACLAGYAYVLYGCYSRPSSLDRWPREIQVEVLHE
jgi:hypothetical protein